MSRIKTHPTRPRLFGHPPSVGPRVDWQGHPFFRWSGEDGATWHVDIWCDGNRWNWFAQFDGCSLRGDFPHAEFADARREAMRAVSGLYEAVAALVRAD